MKKMINKIIFFIIPLNTSFYQRPRLRRMFVLCSVIEQDGVDSTSGLFILNESFVFYLFCRFVDGTGLSLY